MVNQTGIAIVIKAFLPTGKTLDEQFEALSKVKNAHETGDYSALLKAAKIDEVKTEQKTRRIDDAPQQADPATDPDFDEIAGQDQPDETTAEPQANDDWAKPMDEEEKELAATTSRRRRA